MVKKKKTMYDLFELILLIFLMLRNSVRLASGKSSIDGQLD